MVMAANNKRRDGMSAPVRIRDSASGKWSTFEELTPPDMRDAFPQRAILESTLFVHAEGDATSPQLTEVRYLPNVAIPPHAHDVDEIMYVAGGEMRVGNRVLRAGSSLFVGSNTLYSLTAGAEGVHLLVFRPRYDMTLIPEAEFHRKRQSGGTAPDG
jgi:quercetin dioxygenase-like cupin family protein